MSNIKKAFENGKAFIAFVTCGDPDLETTAKAVRAAVENGADLIELGIPFSDPTAEGPVIQGANLRALRGGITTDKIFAFVKELRRDVKVPMVFMTYANVVFSYGAEKFISTCRDIGNVCHFFCLFRCGNTKSDRTWHLRIFPDYIHNRSKVCLNLTPCTCDTKA